MHPLMMDLLPLVRQGYCCSQLLMQLLVQAQGREVPDLVRALWVGPAVSASPAALRSPHGRCLGQTLAPSGGQSTKARSSHPALVSPCSMTTPAGFTSARKGLRYSCEQVALGLGARTAAGASPIPWPSWRPAGRMLGKLS